MSHSNLVVGTLYPDGEMKTGADGIGFACPNPILCYIQRVDTLDELKNFILRTMGAVGRKHVRRIAYRLLNILPPLEYKFKIFWVEGDVHVRALFELHQRYDPRQVIEPLVETRDAIRSEAGPSCTWAAYFRTLGIEKYLGKAKESIGSKIHEKEAAQTEFAFITYLGSPTTIPSCFQKKGNSKLILFVTPRTDHFISRPGGCHCCLATPDVSMDMDSGSYDISDGDYLGESAESTDSFDEAEYVDES
ncbi:hypothetical protein PIB30_032145 [Stylosanthes scabra]|uniref:Uncharacterized protein n=1 Tax=Stylosanthes scabra TaxID=79078 RepID=A0ABU6XBV3_9FABA|nr:hypothetical protein [Stylosanthes scabra]